MTQDHRPTAVFDLDGTLLSADSTAEWLKWLLRESLLKGLAGLAVLPFALPLVTVAPLRRHGGSLLLWIASHGFDEGRLKASMDAFVRRFEAGEASFRWYAEGIATLDQHLAAGHRVVVVTAAPQWLAERLLAPWLERLTVIGSSLRRVGRGWVVDQHVRGALKAQRLAEEGFGKRWSWAYSDSDDDAPMLAPAEQAFLVNAGAGKHRRTAARGCGHAVGLRWR
ncbi:haloacid dehalogenase-like hydrolase [Bacillus sp. NP157]|nr:haloacid dehalogenase-like hydrolase [Bacillus sp. NP157]